MTPDLGQGACQALEDAATLAAAIAGHPDTATALQCWDRQRRQRTQAVAARSRRAGTVAQWRFGPARALRDGLLAVTPRASFTRSLDSVVGWPLAGPPGGQCCRAAQPART